MELIQELDWSILNWIAEHMHNGVLDVVMISFTAIGEIGLVWILLSLWKILSKDLRKRKEGILMIVAILVGVLIANVILKNTVCRSRPCWLNETVDLLIKNPKDYSFPSGHTMASAISATVMCSLNFKRNWWTIPLALAISFSRLYLYVHFPSDVLAAAIMGVIVGLSCVTVYRRFVVPKVRMRAMYICVKDMPRAIAFYEGLLDKKVSKRDDVYSVFKLMGMRFGLFAYEKKNEPHEFGSNCLPSIELCDKELLLHKIEGQEVCFPLTQIGSNWVVEIVDSEGNHVEITAPV